MSPHYSTSDHMYHILHINPFFILSSLYLPFFCKKYPKYLNLSNSSPSSLPIVITLAHVIMTLLEMKYIKYIFLNKIKIKDKIQTRGKILMEMIKLDTVSYSLLDLSAIPYEQYIKMYGHLNMTQVKI